MKRKLHGRLRSKLWKELLPELDVSALAHAIGEFLNTDAGKAARGKAFANILASYLAQKYSITDRRGGELRRLIERHPDEVGAFLDEARFKEFLALVQKPAGDPQPISLKEFAQALLKPLDKGPPSENKVLPAEHVLPRRKKKRRPRAKTEAERARRRKEAKNRYEERRSDYRRGLIVEQFGTYPALYPHEQTPPEGDCLDVLLSGEAVSKAAHAGSLEDLFGIDRKRFPKSLRGKRHGRKIVYDLREFLKCMIHLLTNPDGKEPWLPEGPQRHLVREHPAIGWYGHTARLKFPKEIEKESELLIDNRSSSIATISGPARVTNSSTSFSTSSPS